MCSRQDSVLAVVGGVVCLGIAILTLETQLEKRHLLEASVWPSLAGLGSFILFLSAGIVYHAIRAFRHR